MTALQDAIDKATSSNLTEDDYGLLLDAVDTVKADPDTNIPESINLVKEKLRSSNANVLLRAITLIDFLAENCGAMMKAEIAKRSFVEDYLVRLVESNSMHVSVKYAVIKEIYKLSKAFKGDDSLSVMDVTFKSLQSDYKYLCDQAIREIDSGREPKLDEGKDQEDEDLRKAIAMSLKENANNGRDTTNQSTQASGNNGASTNTGGNNPTVNAGSGSNQTTNAGSGSSIERPSKLRVLYDLSTNDDDTLTLKQGDIVTVIEPVNKDWVRGCVHGKMGIVPLNYVEPLKEPTDEEIKKIQSCGSQSRDIEMLLSQLMDLNSKLQASNISNQDFESYLIRNGIPSKLERLQAIKTELKGALDVLQMRQAEMQSIEDNIDASVSLYQRLLVQSNSRQFQEPPSGEYMAELNNQMAGMSLSREAPQMPHLPNWRQ